MRLSESELSYRAVFSCMILMQHPRAAFWVCMAIRSRRKKLQFESLMTATLVCSLNGKKSLRIILAAIDYTSAICPRCYGNPYSRAGPKIVRSIRTQND